MDADSLLEPFALIPGLTLRNRVAMAPMTTWAADDDGTVSHEEEAWYRRRVGDVGLVITGCTHVQANGVGFTGEFAAHDDSFIPSLARLAIAAKSGGAPAILQIFHAGGKTRSDLVADVVAASAVEGEAGPFSDALMPRALADAEVEAVVQAFGDATRRAIIAGFDGVELHGAHGFLLQNFLSPHSNRRGDRWGGSLKGRQRFPLEVVAQVRHVIATCANRPFALGYRLTCDEPYDDGLRMADSLVLVDGLIGAGIDYLHASLGQALDARPVDAPEGPAIITILRDHLAGRIPLIAAGQIRTPLQAKQALNMGLSAVAIGQALVMNPDWVAQLCGETTTMRELAIGPEDVAPLAVPPKLWRIIASTPGWFPARGA
ncbi:NADH-dependent flavin oxidoreductase [Novosphingobium sp.]|uniref:NADH-dependent flavin oxidoreductase n=1 Tax=Novosphingobium sp. TaxID=1874826 RepID=UPI0031DDACE9